MRIYSKRGDRSILLDKTERRHMQSALDVITELENFDAALQEAGCAGLLARLLSQIDDDGRYTPKSKEKNSGH